MFYSCRSRCLLLSNHKPAVNMKFEDILDEINGFGPFQMAMVVLLSAPRMVLPCHFLLNNFIAASPPHRCDIGTLGAGGLFENLTEEQRLTVSLPAREDGRGWKSCEMFAEPQFQLLANGSRGADPPTLRCQSGWVYDNSTFTSTLATEVQPWSCFYQHQTLCTSCSLSMLLNIANGMTLPLRSASAVGPRV